MVLFIFIVCFGLGHREHYTGIRTPEYRYQLFTSRGLKELCMRVEKPLKIQEKNHCG